MTTKSRQIEKEEKRKLFRREMTRRGTEKRDEWGVKYTVQSASRGSLRYGSFTNCPVWAGLSGEYSTVAV